MHIKIIIITFFFLTNTFTYSYYRFGKITKNFTYDVKSIEEHGNNKCKLILEIENNSNKGGGVSANLIAHDIHKNVYWNIYVNSGYVQSNDDVTLKYIIHNCNKINPYKLIFR